MQTSISQRKRGWLGLSETALTGRMRAEGLHLSCLLRSWLTDGCTYQLCAILLIKSQRRAWLNTGELACLLSSPRHHNANNNAGEILHGSVRRSKTFLDHGRSLLLIGNV